MLLKQVRIPSYRREVTVADTVDGICSFIRSLCFVNSSRRAWHREVRAICCSIDEIDLLKYMSREGNTSSFRLFCVMKYFVSGTTQCWAAWKNCVKLNKHGSCIRSTSYELIKNSFYLLCLFPEMHDKVLSQKPWEIMFAVIHTK